MFLGNMSPYYLQTPVYCSMVSISKDAGPSTPNLVVCSSHPFPSLHAFTHPSIHHPSTHPFSLPSIHLLNYLNIHPPIHSLIPSFFYPSILIYLSIHTPFHPSVHPLVHPSTLAFPPIILYLFIHTTSVPHH